VQPNRLVTLFVGASLAAALAGCSALTHPEELTITAEAIPSMNAPPPAATAPAPSPQPGTAAPAQGG
jgi:enterochelin esterase-like enzyme